MKYHKIPGIEKSVCTAEQKAAYNLAFRSALNGRDYYNKLENGVARSAFIGAEIKTAIESWKRDGNKNLDVDAIFSALNAGLENYYKNFFVASNYNQIGQAFPALYL